MHIGISDARKDFPSVVDSAHAGEVVYIEKRGHVVAVMVDPQHYIELSEAYDDLVDVAAFDEAMAEEGPDIPWDLVKADLGLT